MSRQGFSLAELATVIVIIGFIAAAISGSRNLVEQAKLTKLISEVEVLRSANQNFITTYNYLPGDFPKATDFWGSYHATNNPNGALNGNGNGIVDNSDSNSFRADPLRIWHHLELAGLISGNYDRDIIDTNAGTLISDTHIPRSKVFFNLNFYYYGSDVSARKPWLLTGKERANDRPLNASLTPKQAYNIDRKMDDAIQNAGYVVGYESYGEDDTESLENYCDTVAAEKYDLASEKVVCNLKFLDILVK